MLGPAALAESMHGDTPGGVADTRHAVISCIGFSNQPPCNRVVGPAEQVGSTVPSQQQCHTHPRAREGRACPVGRCTSCQGHQTPSAPRSEMCTSMPGQPSLRRSVLPCSSCLEEASALDTAGASSSVRAMRGVCWDTPCTHRQPSRTVPQMQHTPVKTPAGPTIGSQRPEPRVWLAAVQQVARTKDAARPQAQVQSKCRHTHMLAVDGLPAQRPRLKAFQCGEAKRSLADRCPARLWRVRERPLGTGCRCCCPTHGGAGTLSGLHVNRPHNLPLRQGRLGR